MSDPTIQQHPEAAALNAEIAVLRERLAGQLAEWHDLMDLERRWLLALYQEKLGAWELKRVELQAAVARAKRRLERFQAGLNEGKVPDLSEIDVSLERELAVWKQKVREAAEAYEQAQRWVQGKPLQEEECAELKKVYRKLVKALHPDLHHGQTEHDMNLWQQVQAAHAANALADLKARAALVGEAGPPPMVAPDVLDALRAQRDQLTGSIVALTHKRAEAEAQPPFTWREKLADETWISARRAEMETEIAPLEVQRTALEAYLQQLITIERHAASFGPN